MTHDNVQEIPDLQVRLGPDDLAEIIYIDRYGNALTGLRATQVSRDAVIALREHRPGTPESSPPCLPAARSGTRKIGDAVTV